MIQCSTALAIVLWKKENRSGEINEWVSSMDLQCNLVYGKLQECCDLDSAKLGPYRCGVNVAGSTRLQYM